MSKTSCYLKEVKYKRQDTGFRAHLPTCMPTFSLILTCKCFTSVFKNSCIYKDIFILHLAFLGVLNQGISSSYVANCILRNWYLPHMFCSLVHITSWYFYHDSIVIVNAKLNYKNCKGNLYVSAWSVLSLVHLPYQSLL